MANTRIEVKKAIEEILEEIADERAYCVANSITCRTSYSADEDVLSRFAVAQCITAQLHEANTDKWRCDVAYHSMTHMGDDESKDLCNRLAEELADIFTTGFITLATATSAYANRGVTIDGIIVGATDDDVEGNYWRATITAQIFCTVASSS